MISMGGGVGRGGVRRRGEGKNSWEEKREGIDLTVNFWMMNSGDF